MKTLASARGHYYPKPCGKERSRKDSHRTLRLFRAYRETGDAEALELLYRQHILLAEFCARRNAKRPSDYDDLYQEACLGLLDALKRYDPERGVEFSTYARYYVEGAIKQYFRDKGWPCTAPRSVKSMALKVRDMGRDLGRNPTKQEVVEAGIPPDKADCAIAAAQAWSSVYLDPEDPAFTSTRLFPSFAYEDADFERMANRLDVRAAVLKTLDRNERDVIWFYYYQDLTKKEVAIAMDTSESNVRRLLARATQKLGATLGDGQTQVS